MSRRFAAGMGGGAAAAAAVAAGWGRVALLRLVLTGLAFGLGLPLIMALCLAASAALLVVFVAATAVVSRCLDPRRPTGARETIADLVRLGLALPPGYVRCLARIRQPLTWGSIAGCLAVAVGMCV